MGSSGSSSTTNTKSEPWDAQKPFLEGTFFEAQNLYQNTNSLAPSYYWGNTVAPQSGYTTGAINMQANRALAGDDRFGNVASASGGVGSILRDPYMNNNSGLQSLESLGNRNWNSGNAGLNYLNSYTGQNTLAGNKGYNTLANMAGQNLNNNVGMNTLAAMTSSVNPYSQTLLNKAIGQQNSQINGNFSQAGRYGSGAHENAVADATTNLTNQFYSNAYDQQQNAANAYAQNYMIGINAQQNAAQAAASTYMQDQANKLGAAENAGNLYMSGLQGQAGAAGSAANAYNAGVSNLNSAAENALSISNQPYTDAAALSDTGALVDEYQQELINADIDRYNYEQQRPMTALANYINLINGTYGGTSTTTGQNTSRSSLSNVNNSNTTQSILAALG